MKNLFLLLLFLMPLAARAKFNIVDELTCSRMFGRAQRYPDLITQQDPSLNAADEKYRLLQFQAKQVSELDKRFDLKSIATVTFKLLERYPLNKYYFVGIGRSPFPIIDLINQISQGSAVTLPISYHEYTTSKLRSRIHNTFHPEDIRSWKSNIPGFSNQNENSQAEFLSHMDQFIPSETELAGREIVAIDFSDMGTSLSKFSSDLIFYLQRRQRPSPTSLVFISWHFHTDDWYRNIMENNFSQNSEKFPLFRTIILSGELRKFGDLLDEEAFKSFAPYDHFVPGLTLGQPVENSAHRLFIKTLNAQFTKWYATIPEFKARIDNLRR